MELVFNFKHDKKENYTHKTFIMDISNPLHEYLLACIFDRVSSNITVLDEYTTTYLENRGIYFSSIADYNNGVFQRLILVFSKGDSTVEYARNVLLEYLNSNECMEYLKTVPILRYSDIKYTFKVHI